ncbi:hypothetical protein JTE90_005978 [Oedothorax gibbosus]|uniref:Uncharacterized protein n=1 Tax=Oedothorax gibbosus TaxID=931172 RepID=A0AAV6UVW4_9ARAC|nr:hypothetical protein JTE90_005978 [Oedothorax gibbosus]
MDYSSWANWLRPKRQHRATLQTQVINSRFWACGQPIEGSVSADSTATSSFNGGSSLAQNGWAGRHVAPRANFAKKTLSTSE